MGGAAGADMGGGIVLTGDGVEFGAMVDETGAPCKPLLATSSSARLPAE